MENLEQNIDSPAPGPRIEVDQLAKRWADIKNKIGELKELQLQVEERITSLVGVKEEGSITQKTSNFRVTTTGGLTRSLELHDPEYYKERLGERFGDLINTKLRRI